MTTAQPRYRAMVAEERFNIIFDGPALHQHHIPADILANSLLALSATTQAAHMAINPLAPRISLDIHATTPGSFSVDLLITDAVAAMNNSTATALATTGTIVTVAYGAIKGGTKLLKWLHTRTIREAEDLSNGQTKITATDGATIITDSTVYIAIQNRAFRESLRDTMQPLTHEGIDSIEIGQSDDVERVTKDDLSAFDVPESGEVLSEKTREAYLQILTLSFLAGNKWRFTEGASPYWATVRDADFINRVADHGVEFGTGDILRADVLTRQRRDGTKLSVENIVVKVHEVVKEGRQVSLPFGDDPVANA